MKIVTALPILIASNLAAADPVTQPTLVAPPGTPITITINNTNAAPAPTPAPAPAPAPPPDDVAPGEVTAPPAPPPPPDDIAPTAPGALAPTPAAACTIVTTDLRTAATARWRAYPPRRALLLGVIGSDIEHGVRASLDLFAYRHLSFGVAGTHVGRNHDDDSAQNQTSLVAYVALTVPLGDRWELRGQLGGGLRRGPAHDDVAISADARATMSSIAADDDDPRTYAIGEAALTVTRRLGDRWGIAAGPVFTARQPAHFDGHYPVDRARADAAHSTAMFVALQRRL